MKTFTKSVLFAVGLEVILASGAMLTFTPSSSGAPRGVLGLVAFVTWMFHFPGYLLADKLTNEISTFWMILFGIGFLEAFGLVWLVIAIYRWKRAS